MRLDLILTMQDIFINSNLDPPRNLEAAQATHSKDIIQRNISDDEINQKLCDKKQRTPPPCPPFEFESQWKLNQQHNQNFPIKGMALQNK